MRFAASLGMFACLGVLGCGGGPALAPGADRVRVLHVAPEGVDLENLGEVSCSQGPDFARDADVNVGICNTRLRNDAAALGADIVVLVSEMVGMGTCANCVRMVGVAYRRR